MTTNESAEQGAVRKTKNPPLKEREIPLISAEELLGYRSDFFQMRSGFAAWCARNQMFYTLSLLTTCEIELRADFPAIAGVGVLDKLTVMFHPYAIKLWRTNPEDAYFIFVHELRHIVQAANLSAVEALVDLSPVRDVLVAKKAEAKEQEHKDLWEKQITRIDDPTNRFWKQKRHMISNVVMDAALHVDVLKLFPRSEERINKFLREEFSPYMRGRTFESAAAEAIAEGNHQKIVDETRKMFGPKKKEILKELEAKRVKDGDVKFIAEVMKMGIGLMTVGGLEDNCRNLPHYQPEFKRQTEWLQLADEYVKWLAQQIEDSTDANSPPQPSGDPEAGEGSGEGDIQDIVDEILNSSEEFDSHEFGDAETTAEKRAEVERRVRDAIRRAEEEGKIMAHRAGVGAGDREMMGDTNASLHSKIQKILEKMKIKFIRIFAESNSKKYTFQKLNRLFAEHSYIPGKMKETRPKPQVVLVMDTSGSCYNRQYINQMLAMARLLHKQEKLAALYFCDTELHKADFASSRKEMAVIGGGGTELSVEICEDIMKRESLREGWELVYATDMQCPGLAEAMKDRRWKIHAIDVASILDQER